MFPLRVTVELETPENSSSYEYDAFMSFVFASSLLAWFFLTQISDGLYFSSLGASSFEYKSLSFDERLFSQLHQSLQQSHSQNGTPCSDYEDYK